MNNLREYTSTAAFDADTTRSFPTISCINDGTHSMRFIRKIATNASNLPLMNLARAANWVASDATFMTNEDAEKVTDITVSKGTMVEGYTATVSGVGSVNVELVDGAYTGIYADMFI